MGDSLHDRGQSLEDSFFHQRDRELLAKLKADAGAGDIRKQLAQALGVHNADVIEKLIVLDMKPEMALAISMVPLVQVAWADGAVQDAERDAILSSAHEVGIADGSPAHGLLQNWMANKPSDTLADAWHGFIQELVTTLSDKERDELKQATLHRAHTVAGVAGGIMGLGSKFSRSEKTVLENLAKAFG